MEPIEAGGLWWLPDAPTAKVPGVLKVDEQGRARIELIGCFRDVLDAAEERVNADGSTVRVATARSFESTGNYGRICGQVGTTEYTLDDCHRGRWSSAIFGGIPSEDVRVGRVYQGVWLEANEDAAFDQANVGLQWLPFWLMESAIGEQWTVEEGPRQQKVHNMQVSVAGLASRSCRPWKGWTVALSHTAGVSGDSITGRTVTQNYYFSITTTGVVSIQNLLDVAANLQTLVSLGVNRAVGIDGLSLAHPQVHPASRRQRRFRRPIEFIVPWSYRDTSEKTALTDYEMAFTFPQIGGMTGVRKFLLAAERHQRSLTKVIASSMAKEMFVSDQLLHRAAALEAFDRVRTQTANVTFRNRLLRTVGYAGSPFNLLVSDTAKWATRVKEERNDSAHTLGLGSDAADQYFIARSLYWLYVICLLRDAGMPQRVFQHIGRHPEFGFVRERLAGMGY